MELRNTYVIFIGIAVLVSLFVFLFIKIKKKDEYKGGKKIANTSYIENEPYYKKKILKYKIYTVIVFVACVLSIAVAFAMLTRPYKTELKEKEKNTRDIMLCIDISTSVDYLNMNLVSELKEVVNNLQGERFGIVIFNTTPVLMTPLTTDYGYIIEQLDMIEKCLDARLNYDIDWEDDDAWDEYWYMDEYISSGTLEGSEERGSSIIGDGLAAAAIDFKSTDEDERTKIIIFSTDNDLQGSPIYTLEEAASLCKKKNILVYGIGTKEMYQGYMDEMEREVEKTGGKFYLEEESGTFKQIVSEIEKTSKSLVKENTEIIEIELVKVPFIILVCVVSVMIIFIKVTKR